jgi:signal transduction histidine kinase
MVFHPLLESVYNVPTAYTISSMVFLVMAVLTWFTMRSERSETVTWWVGGGVLIAAGLMALGLRQPFPELLPFNTGFTLIVAGEVLHLHALALERGKNPALWRWLGLALLAVAAKEMLYRAAPEGSLHAIFGYLVLTVLLLTAAFMARQIAQREGLRSALWLGRFSLLAGTVFGLRTLTGLAGLSAPEALNNQASGVLTTFVVVGLALVDSFCFIGIYLERAQQRNTKMALEEDRARAAAELTAQVAHLDRQRSLGEMAASLAHELGQPITGVLINASTLRQGLLQGDARTGDLSAIAQDIVDQAGRARQILQGIHNFIKPHPQALMRLHLSEVIAGAQNILLPQMRSSDVTVSTRCTSQAPWVQGDRVQLSQVFLNLLRNSIQARRPMLPLTIDILIRDVGALLEVVVQDNGQGMSEDDLARCCTAFFSTKPDGMGMGLAICRRILEHHGGELSMSRPVSGTGLCSTLRLPRAPVA